MQAALCAMPQGGNPSPMPEDWFIEKHTPYAGLSLAVAERL